MVTRRHHTIRDVIVSMVTKAGGKATEEPRNFQAYGDEKRKVLSTPTLPGDARLSSHIETVGGAAALLWNARRT